MKLKIITAITLLLSVITLSAQLSILSDGSTKGGQAAGSLRLQTNYRYTDFGCKSSNGHHSHFNTNAIYGYHFDKGIEITGGKICSFTGDLKLGTQRNYSLTLYQTPQFGGMLGYYKMELNGVGKATRWVESSDSILKEEISMLDESEIDDLLSIKGKKYKLKEQKIETEYVADSISTTTGVKAKKPEQPTSYGLIAQEVEKVYPNLVFEGKDGTKAIHYSGFIPVIIEALKKQDQEIKRLKAELNGKNKMAAKKALPGEISGSAALFQNAPNPFSSETEIRFMVPETVQNATLNIYNLQGRQIKSIAIHERGEASIILSGSELEAGMYIYSLISDGVEIDTKRMILTD